MAKADRAKQQQPAPTRSKQSFLVWGSIIFGLLFLVALPTMTLLLIGMLPTIVAYIIDRTQQKHTAFCVGGMNFLGVYYPLMQLWTGEHPITEVADLMPDLIDFLMIYGAAGFGWLLFTSIPPVVAAFLTVMAQRRVATLRATQRHLIEEWGDNVAASSDEEQRPA